MNRALKHLIARIAHAYRLPTGGDYSTLKAQILKECGEFPETVFPTGIVLSVLHFTKIDLFPLGDFRQIFLPPIEGYTTLYIGRDRLLYEYGPAKRRLKDEDNPAADNPLSIRQLNLENLSFADFFQCLELLRRIHVI